MTKNGGLMFAGRENELKILNRVFLSKRQESVLYMDEEESEKQN